MLTLTVEFLTGRCVATARQQRAEAEWPPHPGRLFDALAASFFERIEDPAALSPDEQAEQQALHWLEICGAAEVCEPGYTSYRTSAETYVPVNDIADGSSRIAEGYDLGRPRQPRHFPAVLPDPPLVSYQWSTAGNDEVLKHRDALARIAAGVTYLGHSSSLVNISVSDKAAACSLRPAAAGEVADQRLRVPYGGRLQQLATEFELARLHGSRRELPPVHAPYIRVKQAGAAIARTVFDDRLQVFRRADKQPLPLTACLRLATAVRGALMSHSPQPVPDVISGHEAAGSPLGATHVSILPLPFVDHQYADGDLKGFAIALPRSIWDEDRRADLACVARAAHTLQEAGIRMGREGAWTIERVTPESNPLHTLDSRQWTRPSRRWATVTPVVFGRFPRPRPGNGKWMVHEKTEDSVREMCAQLDIRDEDGNAVTGVDVQVSSGSVFRGVPPADHFPTLSTRGKPVYMEPTGEHREGARWTPRRQRPPGGQQSRWTAHVVLTFPAPVRGPLVIGSGRYLGLGLCKPYDSKGGGQ